MVTSDRTIFVVYIKSCQLSSERAIKVDNSKILKILSVRHIFWLIRHILNIDASSLRKIVA
jgi:hypothetical protein